MVARRLTWPSRVLGELVLPPRPSAACGSTPPFFSPFLFFFSFGKSDSSFS